MSRSSRRPSLPRRSKLVLGLAALGLLGAGVYLGFRLAKPPPRPLLGGRPAGPSIPPPVEPPAATEPPDLGPLDPGRQPAPGGPPRVAIIIDDLGRRPSDLDDLAALDVPLTYAVLPYESRTPEVVAELKRRGAFYICHLPMEAKGGNDPGPGALLEAMSRDELIAATHHALAAVDGAAGVNNHMGSVISADREAITTVLQVLSAEGLFYVDSRTSTDTLGYAVARQLGIPTAERQVFIDAEIEQGSIREQFARLIALAEERGGAIGIAHPHPETLEVLRQEVGAARRRGIEFVTVDMLLERGG